MSIQIANHKNNITVVNEAILDALNRAGFTWIDRKAIDEIFESEDFAFIIPQGIWNSHGLSSVSKPDKVIINYNSENTGIIRSLSELRGVLGGEDKLLRDSMGKGAVHFSSDHGALCAAEEGSCSVNLKDVSCKYCLKEVANTTAKLVGVIN